MKVSNADISKIKTNLDRSIQFLEQIRGTINAGIPQHRQNPSIPIDLFIQNLRILNTEIKDYNLYYSEQIQNNISRLINNNGSINPYQFGEISSILRILKNEIDNSPMNSRSINCTNNQTEIFIGHGHNLIWARIGLYLSDILKIKPRYFEDENRCGDIIPDEIEKFVNDPNIKLGIFTLMKEIESDEGDMPRQNVVDEAARFSTKLGRERVLLIVEDGVQIPSNLSGIVRIQYKDDEEGLMLKIKDFIEKFN